MARKISGSSITKQIVFPSKLIDRVNDKINSLGLAFPEYVRFLIMKDIERENHNQFVADRDLEARIGNAYEDIAAGRVVKVANKAELSRLLKSL